MLVRVHPLIAALRARDWPALEQPAGPRTTQFLGVLQHKLQASAKPRLVKKHLAPQPTQTSGAS